MDFTALAEKVGNLLKEKSIKLATVESCTGGWISQVITSIPGSSTWFERGFITYSNESKHELLGVSLLSIDQEGAVCKTVALEMAAGAIKHSKADVSLAITGIAGPGGGSEKKPVGLIYIAICSKKDQPVVTKNHFKGDRQKIREQAVEQALVQLIEYIHRQ